MAIREDCIAWGSNIKSKTLGKVFKYVPLTSPKSIPGRLVCWQRWRSRVTAGGKPGNVPHFLCFFKKHSRSSYGFHAAGVYLFRKPESSG